MTKGMINSSEIVKRVHNEHALDGFTKLDGTVRFFGFVRSVCRPGMRILDFGAGRGAWFEDEPSWYKRQLRDLRDFGGSVVAADIDPVVHGNSCSDEQVVLKQEAPLPFQDGEFDLIVSDFVFEHIENPAETCAELRRITRSGGWICVRTANRYGYVALFSLLVPNRRHKRVLRSVQPQRNEIDVFPTRYQLNTIKDIRRHFDGCKIHYYFDSAEPAYFFNRAIIYRILLVVHKLLPEFLQTGLAVFIRVP